MTKGGDGRGWLGVHLYVTRTSDFVPALFVRPDPRAEKVFRFEHVHDLGVCAREGRSIGLGQQLRTRLIPRGSGQRQQAVERGRK